MEDRQLKTGNSRDKVRLHYVDQTMYRLRQMKKIKRNVQNKTKILGKESITTVISLQASQRAAKI